MGRRSFFGIARHCTADDDKGGAGFFRCRRFACSCILACWVGSCKGASAAHPQSKRSDRIACTCSSLHGERHGAGHCSCLVRVRVVRLHPVATCAAQRSLGNSASSQQAPASSSGASGAVVDPIQHAMPHHRAINREHATVRNGSAEHVTDPAAHLVGRTLRAFQVLEAG